MYNKNEVVLGKECFPMYCWSRWVAEIDGVWHTFEEVSHGDDKLELRFIELCPVARKCLGDIYPVVHGVVRCACHAGEALEFVQLYHNPQMARESALEAHQVN